MSNKNKNRRANQHVYIDRSQVLRDSQRQMNVACGIIAIPCIGKEKTGSLERHFKHKLVSSEGDATMLTALVMHNDICVLVIKSAIEGVTSATFKIEVDSDSISGKKKKGAKKIKAGSSVLLLTHSDGSVHEYFTPVGGQLLEANLNLLSNPNLLFDQPNGTGFVAVVYPDTELPSLTNGLLARTSCDQQYIEEKKSNSCFSFAKGLCTRGDKCKFKHDLSAIQSANPNAIFPQRGDSQTVIPQAVIHGEDQNIDQNEEDNAQPDSKKQRVYSPDDINDQEIISLGIETDDITVGNIDNAAPSL